MKLHHFRDVVAIAERGSLRAAARYLGLAQPALTRSLAELERELGSALFERQARGVVLTPMGQAFVRRASAIQHEVRRAREEVDQLQGGTRGSVAVGLSIAPHTALLPRVLAPFRLTYPEVQLHIVEGPYRTVEASLRSGTIDFYLGPEPERPVPTDLVSEFLFANTRMVFCRRGHPLASATSLAQLSGAEWATTSVTESAEEELGRLFEAHGLPLPRLALRSQSALTMIVTLAYTDLLAMLPVQLRDFEPTLSALQSIRLGETLVAPSIVAVRRGGMPLTPAATFLLDLFHKSVPRQN